MVKTSVIIPSVSANWKQRLHISVMSKTNMLLRKAQLKIDKLEIEEATR